MRGVLRTRRAVAAAVALVLTLGIVGVLAAAVGGPGERREARPTDAANPHPVAGNFKPDETDLASCDLSDTRCLEQGFGNLAYESGPKPALAELDRRMAIEREVEADCHRIAHTIGSAALARFEGNVAQAFAEGSASCWSGYYHGILERSFAGVSSRDEAGQVARGVCDDAEIKASTFLFYQCVHGLGHGLMIYSGYDLPWALATCDRLADSWEQTSCTGGVFMENISSSYGVTSKWVRADDPVFPCREMKERHKLYCYLMVTSRINELNGFDWERTAATCRSVERAWVSTCFESFGRDASGFTRQSPKRVAAICAAARANAVDCIYGAARDMTSNYAGGEEASRLCRLAARMARPRCYEGIGTILGSLHVMEDERRAACESVTPPRYERDCLRGAAVL
jgi:hypothetical protein